MGSGVYAAGQERGNADHGAAFGLRPLASVPGDFFVCLMFVVFEQTHNKQNSRPTENWG